MTALRHLSDRDRRIGGGRSRRRKTPPQISRVSRPNGCRTIMRSPLLFLLTVVLLAGCTEVSPSDRSTYAAILDLHSDDGATVTIDRRTHLPQDVKDWLANFLAIGEAAPCFGGHGLSRTIVKDFLVKNARSSWLRGDIQGVRTTGGTLFLLKASEDSLEVIDSCYWWAS